MLTRRQARLSEEPVGSQREACRQLTRETEKPTLQSRPEIDHQPRKSGLSRGFAAGLPLLQPSSLSRFGDWLLQLFGMGTALLGDGLHERLTPPLANHLALRESKTAHQDSPPSGRLGRLAQIPIDAAEPQGGNRATEMPCWEEAADVADRRAN